VLPMSNGTACVQAAKAAASAEARYQHAAPAAPATDIGKVSDSLPQCCSH
jgi:hypothetical protein